MPAIVDHLNAAGGQWDFVVSQPTGRDAPRQQFAYLFRRQRVLLDRQSLYHVLDPDDLLNHEPYVAAFRAVGVDPHHAFTFTLVNTLVSDQFPESLPNSRPCGTCFRRCEMTVGVKMTSLCWATSAPPPRNSMAS